MQQNSVEHFYDEFASDYHLIFANWEASVQRQGTVLHRLIRSQFQNTTDTLTVLDCACGIGTQAIGLAKQGDYEITATDISHDAVERAKNEAKTLGAEVQFAVADIRQLDAAVQGSFNVVIAFDNVLPHFISDEDLQLAADSIFHKTAENGLFMASIRDYNELLEQKPEMTSERVFDDPEGKRVTFQLWEWDDDTYNLTQFLLEADGDDWKTRHFTTRYRAYQRSDLTAAFQKAGFRDVRWWMPEDSGFYQPIIVAWR